MKSVMTLLIIFGSCAFAESQKFPISRKKKGTFFMQCLHTGSALMASKDKGDQFDQKYQSAASKYCEEQKLKKTDDYWNAAEHPSLDGCSLAMKEFSPKHFTDKQINYGINEFCKEARKIDEQFALSK